MAKLTNDRPKDSSTHCPSPPLHQLAAPYSQERDCRLPLIPWQKGRSDITVARSSMKINYVFNTPAFPFEHGTSLSSDGRLAVPGWLLSRRCDECVTEGSTGSSCSSPQQQCWLGGCRVPTGASHCDDDLGP